MSLEPFPEIFILIFIYNLYQFLWRTGALFFKVMLSLKLGIEKYRYVKYVKYISMILFLLISEKGKHKNAPCQ